MRERMIQMGLCAALLFTMLLHGCSGASQGPSKGTPPTLAITTTSLSPGQTGTAYSATLTATGGTPPYTWSISSGQLPPGLTLAATSGEISGTPSEAISSSFTVQVADSASPNSSTTKSLALNVTSTTVDQYGGRLDISCTNTTGMFTLAKVNNRWWFCTPAGHVFIGMFFSNTFNNNPTLDQSGYNTYLIYGLKYAYGTDTSGTGNNREWQMLKRATHWGFNGIGV